MFIRVDLEEHTFLQKTSNFFVDERFADKPFAGSTPNGHEVQNERFVLALCFGECLGIERWWRKLI